MLPFKPEWEIGPIIIIQIGRAVLCLSSATPFSFIVSIGVPVSFLFLFLLDAPVERKFSLDGTEIMDETNKKERVKAYQERRATENQKA